MATIKPFRALHPNPFYADKLVFPGDEQVFFFGVGENELPLLSLKEQLEAPARTRPETAEGQQQGYKAIHENLKKLLDLDRLRKDDHPGIYIYEIVHQNYRQTGIWALTDMNDFFNGKIKLHESTLEDSERRIAGYRENTGLEGGPVLLTYMPSLAINRIIVETCSNNKKTTIGSKKTLHRIWKIEDHSTLKTLVEAFKKIDNVYMADGHHRLAGTARLSLKKGGGFISSMYIAADQLRIREYYRVIIPESVVDSTLLLQKLNELFQVRPSKDNLPIRPEKQYIFGMCISGKWFELESSSQGESHAALLQQKIFAPLFGIIDPRSDSRLKYIGGELAMDETQGVLKAIPAAIAFTLSPLTVEELVAVAENGKILPPKSTWIDPKVPYGLLLVQHSIHKAQCSFNHYD